jgi:CBS domain-containing protein
MTLSSYEHAPIEPKLEYIIDIKNTNIVSVEENTTLHDVILYLITNKISKIFVKNNNKEVGIITDKDIIRFLFIDKSGRKLDQIYASEIMNGICFVVGSMTCQQAAQMMLINKISTLGIGSKGKLEGMITKTDLIKYYTNSIPDKSKISNFMTVSYFSSSLDDKLHDIIKKMIIYDISSMVMTDSKRKAVGIITNGDIFRITMATNKMDIVQSSLSNYTDPDGLWSETGFVGSQLASEVMTEGIITINSNLDMLASAKMILDKRIDNLGVNNDNGELIGLINKTNVLYALATFRWD